MDPLTIAGALGATDVDAYCLHKRDGHWFCYAPPIAVFVRAGDGFTTPVCEAHVEAGQAAIRGQVEVVPPAEWLARPRVSQAARGWAGS
jgi:hypothetical protein